MKLAKDCIDVGVRTNKLEVMLEFKTQKVGLPYGELLKIGGGVHRHHQTLKALNIQTQHCPETLTESSPRQVIESY
jgi:hypothetical protein